MQGEMAGTGRIIPLPAPSGQLRGASCEGDLQWFVLKLTEFERCGTTARAVLAAEGGRPLHCTQWRSLVLQHTSELR